MDFKESRKGKFIGLGCVYLIALVLMLCGIFAGMLNLPADDYYTKKFVCLGLILPLSLLYVIKLLFDVLYLLYKKKIFSVFSIIFGVLQLYGIEALTFGIEYKSLIWLIFIDCCICGLAIPLSRLITLAIQGIINSLNIGFCGEKPMRLWRKIAEVFLQIALLPISVILQVFAIPYTLMGMNFLGALIIEYLFYSAMKKEKHEAGYSYNVSESDTIVSETVTHEIRNTDGVVIGTYDTTEQHVEHDNGYRYAYSDQDIKLSGLANKHVFMVLPLRVISLLFSIIAIFVPNMYVSAIRPKTKYQYSFKAFMYADILIFYDGFEKRKHRRERIDGEVGETAETVKIDKAL